MMAVVGVIVRVRHGGDPGNLKDHLGLAAGASLAHPELGQTGDSVLGDTALAVLLAEELRASG